MYSRLAHDNFHGGWGRRQFDSHTAQGYNEPAGTGTAYKERKAMKRLRIALTILVLLAGPGITPPAIAGDSFWTQCSQGMRGSIAMALAISPDYATDGTIFAGTYDGGAFKSTNGGVSWSAVNTGLTNLKIQVLALSPGYASDHTIFAGTDGGGIFKTSNGGASWSTVNMGLTNLEVQALALSPDYATDHTLFAGMYSAYYNGGVFKSSDGGASWNALGLNNLSVFALAISPGYASDHTLFAGADGGVFQSTDGGVNWSAVNTGLTNLEVYTLGSLKSRQVSRIVVSSQHA
jgi:photosystem II stability/assembly factor-like uncharacterized protein